MMRLLALASVIVITAMSAAVAPAHAEDPVVVTDIVGRQVTIKRPIKRILLGEGRQLLTLSLIHPDPVSLLAGWPADLIRQDATTYGR